MRFNICLVAGFAAGLLPACGGPLRLTVSPRSASLDGDQQPTALVGTLKNAGKTPITVCTHWEPIIRVKLSKWGLRILPVEGGPYMPTVLPPPVLVKLAPGESIQISIGGGVEYVDEGSSQEGGRAMLLEYGFELHGAGTYVARYEYHCPKFGSGETAISNRVYFKRTY